jgi:hypothetical protein
MIRMEVSDLKQINNIPTQAKKTITTCKMSDVFESKSTKQAVRLMSHCT